MPIPKLIITAALMAVQVGLQMTQRIKGPRLDSLKTTTAEYGTPIPRFWGKRKFEVPIIWAEDLRETKHTSKGKAGKNTQYKYYASFAVLISDHEIDGVTRIWMDDKLVYQTTDVGPVSVGAAAGLTVGGNMRVYLGTEDQEADPRMEAWCDDRYGPNSCPAYRGSAYIVFEELPVNNFGNRIPNITVEAVNNKSDILPYEQLSGGNGDIDGLSPDFNYLYQIAGTTFQTWDLPSRTVITTVTMPSGVSDRIAVSTGVVYALNGLTSPFEIWTFRDDGTGASVGTVTGPGAYSGLSYKAGQLFAYPANTNEEYIGVVGGTTIAQIMCGFSPTHYFQDADDPADWWAVGTEIGDVNLGIYSSDDATTTTNTDHDGGAVGMDNGAGQLLIAQGGYLQLWDKATKTKVDEVAFNPVFKTAFLAFDNVIPGASSIWIGSTHFDTRTLEIIESVDPLDWVTETTPFAAGNVVYSPALDALVSVPAGGTTVTIRYLHRIDSAGVTLKTVVDSVSGWCGLTGQDTTALTQTVLGYSVTQGSGKDMIGPLLDIYDVDCRPHDFQVQFVNRGGAPSGTLLTEDFVRNGDRYKVTIKQDTDLPKDITINFVDWDHDQNANNVISTRPSTATSSDRSETIDLSTFADTADGAQQKADRYLRRSWNSREMDTLSLTAQHLALEPGDVTTISLDGTLRNVRLDKMTIAGQQLDCEFIRDETGFAVLNNASGPAFEGSDTDVIVIPGPTRGFILDGPLVRDADNDVNPIIYYAAGGYISDWFGAGVYRGDDGTYDEDFAVVDSSQNATWGAADTELATANPNLWDRGNTLDVTVYGSLTSHTEAEINADTELNLFALGETGRWEYIQFATATLTGTSGPANTYTLSGFKRGRRGTEGNVGTHGAGDTFLMLDRAYPAELGAGDVGEDISFKVQSFGRDPEAAAANDVHPYTGASLKPYAPARVKWVYDGIDLQGTIFRRTRVGGLWNGSTISLGETSEAYEVEIYNGVTLKRTISVSGTNAFTYSAAMAAADGISLPTPPTILAYQMSSTVGRGFALAA